MSWLCFRNPEKLKHIPYRLSKYWISHWGHYGTLNNLQQSRISNPNCTPKYAATGTSIAFIFFPSLLCRTGHSYRIPGCVLAA